MTRVFRLSSVALLLVCAASAVAAAKPTVAILGLEVIDKTGVPSNDDVTFAKTLTEDLRGRAKLGGPYTLANGADKELIDLKLLKGCDDDKDLKCMSGIGGDLGVDFLMYGSVTKKGSNYEITISLLDVKQRHREKTAPTTVPTSTNAGTLLKKSQSIYNGLTGQTDSCTITVKTPGVDRATILLGTKEAGNITNGVGQVNGLSEGKYSIAVEAKDYHRWTKGDIQCTGGETTNITADLSKLDRAVDTQVTGTSGSPGALIGQTGTESHSEGHGKTAWKVMAYGGLAGAAVGGGLWIYGFSKTSSADGFKQSELNFNNANMTLTYDQSQCDTTDGKIVRAASGAANSKFDSGCTGHAITNYAVPITLGFAVVSAVGFIMLATSKESEDRPASVSGRRHHHEPFAIAPVVSPTGAGATFRMEW